MASGFVWVLVYWLACAVWMGLAYRVGRLALGVLGTVARGDRALLAEVLVFRQEYSVLRRQVARVCRRIARGSWRCPR